MSRLFSSARAIVSCNERYRLPARSRASSRGVSARLSLGCGTGRYGLVILPTMPVFIVVAGSSGGAAPPPARPPRGRGGGVAQTPRAARDNAAEPPPKQPQDTSQFRL